MTTQLPERLRALADEAPEALSAGDLWQAGRRRQRTRFATSLAVVGGLVIAMVALGYGDWQSRRPDPAAPPATKSGPMAIPDRFFAPSPRLPSTSSPGRLVAVMDQVTRGHALSGPTQGVVGVAAGSQRYTFLDLPHLSTDVPGVALAPDGLHLAYIIDGPVPNTPTKEDDAFGVAVLDLATGDVERHDIPSPYGINNVTFIWASTSVLLTAVTRRFDAPPGKNYQDIYRGTTFRYVVGSPQGRRLPNQNIGYPTISVASDAAYATAGIHRSVQLRSPDTGRVESRFSTSERSDDYNGAVDSAERRFATLRGNVTPATLTWGRVRNGRVQLRDVRGKYDASVLAWSDSRHLVASKVRGTHGPVWVIVDVRDGSSRVSCATLVVHRWPRTPSRTLTRLLPWCHRTRGTDAAS